MLRIFLFKSRREGNRQRLQSEPRAELITVSTRKQVAALTKGKGLIELLAIGKINENSHSRPAAADKLLCAPTQRRLHTRHCILITADWNRLTIEYTQYRCKIRSTT